MSNKNPVKIGLIGGSGLGEALGAEAGETCDLDTPFGKPSAPIVQTEWEGTPIAILKRHGNGHIYNPTNVPYRANIYALKALGVTHIVASGATGSLQEDIAPGDLVIADQVIDKTFRRANSFYDHGAVHIEFSEPFCPVMRDWLLGAAHGFDDSTVHRAGTYVCMEGPAFSTKAESHMHRQWGGDLIGMTVMPEAKLRREAEMAYALVAMPTDYDCWRPHDPDKPVTALLEEIMGNLQKATQNNIALIRRALRDTSKLAQQRSPAHDALTLGIWSEKSKLDASEVRRLRVLWGRYFEAD